MTKEGKPDLALLDERVRDVWTSIERAVLRFKTEDGRNEARVFSPFAEHREIASKSTFDAVRSLEPGALESAHRDGLLRWIHELLQARVAWELAVDEADAVHAIDPSLSRRASNDRSIEIATTFDAALDALVDASSIASVELAINRLDGLASPVAAVRKELRSRRFEAARRLGLPHPWALAVTPRKTSLEGGTHGSGPTMSVAKAFDALARAVLDATEPLAVEIHKNLRRRSGSRLVAALAMHDAFARDAREGWPARLTPRWLDEVFHAVAPRPPRVAHLPRAVGGASFLRAAAVWGRALRQAGTPRLLPFALARDPFPTGAFTFGAAFALTVADRVFAKRKLGLPARSADAHARTLARTLLFTLRTSAANVVLGMSESVNDEVESLGERIFGGPLPKNAAAVWAYGGFSGSSRIDAPARLVGTVASYGLVRDLVDRYDEDWFDNPRAGTHLSGIAAGPIGTGEIPDIDSIRAIAARFEEMLG